MNAVNNAVGYRQVQQNNIAKQSKSRKKFMMHYIFIPTVTIRINKKKPTKP